MLCSMKIGTACVCSVFLGLSRHRRLWRRWWWWGIWQCILAVLWRIGNCRGMKGRCGLNFGRGFNVKRMGNKTAKSFFEEVKRGNGGKRSALTWFQGISGTMLQFNPAEINGGIRLYVGLIAKLTINRKKGISSIILICVFSYWI